MRRILSILLATLTLGCGSDALGPVTTVDGHWAGIQNGYSISFYLTQSSDNVTGTMSIGGVAGFANGTVSGTFVYPNIDLLVSIPSSETFHYTGAMSATEASIDGRLNGSGFENLAIKVLKKKE